MISQSDKKRNGIYGANFIIPSLVNFLKNTPRISEVANKIPGLDKIASSANPYGAAFYGLLNIAGRFSDRIKSSRLTRLSELAGSVFYGASTIADMFSIAEGDYTALANLLFDGSMTYQLGKDASKDYEGKDFLDDLTKW